MVRNRSLVLFVAFALSLVGAAACAGDESVTNAEAGECIESVADLSGQISDLPEAECTEAHEAEVIGLFEHEGGDDDFDAATVGAEAAEACQGDIFSDYTGTPYEESAITVSPVTPTEGSWGDGDRESICVASFNGEAVEESFEGNGENYLLGG